MTNHPNRSKLDQAGQYAIVDAFGAYDSAWHRKSFVHGAYNDRDAALRAARRMRQVQVILAVGGLAKGQTVFEDAIGSTYSRVPA